MPRRRPAAPRPLPLLLLLTALLGLAPSAGAAAPPRTRAERIRQVENGLLPYVPVQGLPGWNLAARMRHHRVPGLSIAVVHNYRLDWAKAYGWADTTRRRPVTPATLFSAGSVSKPVAAVAALLLAQQGRLDLDAPVNSLLRSWQLPDNELTRQQPVTLRRLLSHQGGTSQASYWGFVPGQPLPTVVEVLSGHPRAESRPVIVNRLPGSGFQYSGGGYLVAQLALMDQTGQDFAALTAAALFRPLRMRRSTFAQPLPAAWAPRAAWAYSENTWFKGMPYVYPQQAPAGLYSTPTDLARFLVEVQQACRGRGALLSQASAQALLTPQAEVSSGVYREQMALGLFLLQRADQHGPASRYFEHTGVNAGFLTYFLGSVTGGEGVVIMMNNDGGAAELGKELRRAVARAYGWPGFLPAAIRPAAAADLDAWAGRYQRGPDEVVAFRREGRYLLESINGGPPILSVPTGGDTLAFTDYPMRGTFTRDAAGQVTGFRMLDAAQPWRRLGPTELLPHELLRAGRIPEAVAGYRALHLGENQLTYMIYELLGRKPANLAGAEGLLTLAREQFPQSSVVQARWGDYHAARGDTAWAAAAYRAGLRLAPTDQSLRDKLRALHP